MTKRLLAKQVAVVTGGGSGIGEGIARLFAREGATVIIANRSEKGERVAQEITQSGGKAQWLKTDVSSSQQVKEMVKHTLSSYGGIDILVNNAAVQHVKPLWELEDAEFEQMLHINLAGYFYCMKQALPVMINRKKGIVINISSNLAFRALSGFAGYSATKGGIVSMSRAVALEAAPFGVRVNCICPGSTITPIMDTVLKNYDDPQAVLQEASKKIPSGRLALPEDIASLALFLASSQSEMILGQAYVIDGGAGIVLQ